MANEGIAPDFLTPHAEAMPEKVAIIDDRPSGSVREISFGALEERANRLAHALLAELLGLA